MKKPFHTFLTGNMECQNNLFYTGVLNPMMKKMLLQNVQDLLSQKAGANSAERIFETSSECLETLQAISNNDAKTSEKKGPVLFNLNNHHSQFQLKLGLSADKKHLDALVNALNEITSEIKTENSSSGNETIEKLFALTQIKSLLKNQTNFSWEIRDINSHTFFLTLKFNLDYEPLSS